jgi:hypothetical protein
VHVRRLALLVPALLLAACTNAPTAQNTSATTTSAASQPLTAEQIVTKLVAKIPTVKLVKTYTAADDPNHQLGRPNGYLSKTAFSDNRVPTDQLMNTEPDSGERGGSVEVFPDAAGAKTRSEYIQTIAKSLPFAAEYDYLKGGILVRVSRLLTPEQAKEYDAALQSISG